MFGAFLVFTGIRMAIQKEHGLDPESNPAIRLIRRLMPVTGAYHGQKFFVREHVAGRLRLVATPLFVVVALVETTDLIFAVDSIPAIFAVTQDPFIVYSSNVFAILGLRALYFLHGGGDPPVPLPEARVCLWCWSSWVSRCSRADVYKVPVGVSLGVIVCVLGASIAASWLWPSTAAAHHVPDPASGAGSAPPDSAGTELRRQFPRVPGEENADSVEPVRGTS